MRSFLWVAATASAFAVCLASCSSGSGDAVTLAPSIVIPQDLLQGVTKLEVSVYDPSNGLSCNADGTVQGVTASTTPLATVDLASTGCPNNVKFCGNISVDMSSNPRLFTAQAFVGTASSPVASGCTSATPNQTTIQVTILMLRTLPPSTCNGNPSSVITQCATGMAGDPVCDQNCQSIEEYFSSGDNSSTSDTKAKVRPMLTWPSASGDPGRLVGVWGEKAAGGNQVSMRLLSDSMEPYTGQSACIAASSFRMPTMSSAPCPGQTYLNPQFDPTIASISGNYFIAYEDGSPPLTGAQAIKARSFDPILTPQQAGNAVVVSATSTFAQVKPSIAASGANLFVAWENGQGSIVGNTLASSAALTPGTQQTLGPGTSVSVAGTASGWVAAYLNGTDVDMVTIDASGTASAPVKVNTTSGTLTHPGIAAFGSTVAVIWADGSGNIFVQRYVSNTPVANDQANALQDPSLMGNQKEPSIAAGTNFFIATWVDNASGHVRARFLDGAPGGVGGYMFNFVNGQSSDFLVSVVANETRDNPVAVSGGAGAYVAIAWEDNTATPNTPNHFGGIWGRRFPLPVAQ